MQNILDLGIRFIVALQGWGTWLTFPMKFLSFLGTEEFFILLLPILYWCVDSLLGIRVTIILMLSTSINGALKLAFHGPRPYWYSPKVHGLAEETSFGIPSNHAQNAIVVWGILAATLRKWWGWLVAILLTLLIGFSRLYLGVHFPQDVVLGWLVGGLILWLTLRFWDPVSAWAKKQSASRQVLAAFLVSLTVFLLPLIPVLRLKATNWQPPADWASYATQAISLQDAATSAGILFGLLIGLVWIGRQGGFQTKGPWWKLVLRYLLGLAGVLVIRYGLKFIFPEGENILAYFLQYLRYTLIGFWVAGAAPWTFIRLKLAEKCNQGSEVG
jgi:membrane-associated phospholipid phosphatase